MALITPSQTTWNVRRIVAELPFIPAASNWLKLLLSLLAEPLMFVSSLYIVAETVIPGAANWSSLLTNGTNTVMSLAPEIILPGCFQQAQFAMNHGNKVRGYLLYGLCALFGALTIVTLASFVWHFTAVVGASLLFIRCGSGISYTIILNIAGPEERLQTVRLHVDNSVDSARIDALTETVENLSSMVSEISEDVLQLLDHTATQQKALPMSTSSTPRLQGVRINVDAMQPDVYTLEKLYSAVDMTHEDVDGDVDMAADSVDDEDPENGDDAASEALRTPCLQRYPDVPGMKPEKVQRIIDAFESGTPWREIGNYSRDVKPVKEAYEAFIESHVDDVDTDKHPVYTL
jgi:archaellum component FlaC